MAELRPRARDRFSSTGQGLKGRCPSEGAEGNDDTRRRQGDLSHEEWQAFVALARGWLVLRRSAPNRRGDARSDQHLTVIDRNGMRLGCKASPMHGSEEPVATSVSGEHAPGPVGAMGCRRQSDDEDTRMRIAESRDPPPPVLLICEGGTLGRRNAFPPGHQTRACSAFDDVGIEQPEGISHVRQAKGPDRRRVNISTVRSQANPAALASNTSGRSLLKNACCVPG